MAGAQWRSRRPTVEAALWGALATGLAAAGVQYAERVRARLAEGYTSGDFVTGHVAGSVEVTPVQRTGDGLRLTVGSNVNYALFWELGHVNLFVRHFVRVEIWRPYLAEMRDVLQATIWRVARQQVVALAGGTAEPSVDVLTGETREQKRGRVGRMVDGP